MTLWCVISACALLRIADAAPTEDRLHASQCNQTKGSFSYAFSRRVLMRSGERTAECRAETKQRIHELKAVLSACWATAAALGGATVDKNTEKGAVGAPRNKTD